MRTLIAAAAAMLLAAPLPAATRPVHEAPALDRHDLKINEIQVLGTHNSYSLPVDPRLVRLAEPRLAQLTARIAAMPADRQALFREEHPNPMTPADMLNYRHRDIPAQLDANIRNPEFDLYPDPVGGLFLKPAGYRVLRAQGVADLLPHDVTGLDQPGFKVLHIPDYDFRSHCPVFQACLAKLRAWSDAHPGHIPLFVMLEAKVDALPLFPDPTRPVGYDRTRFDELDREILTAIGRDRIITPDDVRAGYPTLNAAIRAHNWPRLSAARGKMLFMISTASGPSGTLSYLDGHPSLAGRVAGLRGEPGEDHSAYLLLDNALVRGADIRRYVAEGYLVRTRTDIETWEAKTNDRTRADAAFASGAQIVSTDFEDAGNPYGTRYRVVLPGGRAARCNPVLRPACAR